MLRFFLLFLGIQLTLFGINMLGWIQQHLVLPWTTLLAYMCAKLVTWFDSSAAASGKVLWNQATGFGVSIEPGCNGIEACIVLFAAMMAFPSTWKHKLAGLVVGFAAVQALNVVRVISLFYLGQWNTAVFNFAHEFLWQGLIMLDVLIVWLLWVRAGAKAQKIGEPPPPSEKPPVLPRWVAESKVERVRGEVSSSLDLSPTCNGTPHASPLAVSDLCAVSVCLDRRADLVLDQGQPVDVLPRGCAGACDA